MIRWNIREVNETRNDLSRNTNYAKKRQRRTTRLTRIRKGGIISRETRYTLHGQIESSEGFLPASLRAETHLEGADTYKETWRTTLHVRWIFNRCTSKHEWFNDEQENPGALWRLTGGRGGGGRGWVRLYRVTSSRLERFQTPWPGIAQWKKNDPGPLGWH